MNHSKYCEKNPKKDHNKKKQSEISSLNRAKISEDARKVTGEKISKAWKDGKYDNVNRSNYTMSEEARLKASERMKRMRAAGIGNYNRKTSIPCEKFKSLLKSENIIFEEEFKPMEKRHFSIDIAFPSKRIGIEINGNQHYSSEGILAPYYQERHDLIEKCGWKLYEIHYKKCFDDLFTQSFISSLKNDLS